MYTYDTRQDENNKSLPWYGWLFPCIICQSITGHYIKKKTSSICCVYNHYIIIPKCYNCQKKKTKLPKINLSKIKKTEIYQN